MISTFSSGGFANTAWVAWKETLQNQMYFLPDFDETCGYYLRESSYRGGTVIGVISSTASLVGKLLGQSEVPQTQEQWVVRFPETLAPT
jgi:hypothetical protein